jgi:hypothetical protein
MNPSTFLPFKTLICFVNGLGALLVPEWYMGIFGLTLDPAGLVMARFMGASFIGIGLICWFYRNAGYKTIQDILLSLFIADSVGTIVALMAQLSGVTNSLGWLVVAMWLVLAAGLGYLRFVKPQTQAAAVGRS